jgi:monofunctional biosynthetic peptidoglycan transglycosylase
MLQTSRKLARKGVPGNQSHQWINYEDMGSDIILSAIVAEDTYFLIHAGFDWESMRLAYEANKEGQPKRGGSTITQQVAKNLFLWPARSYFRKILEAYFTILLEGSWSKRRILEVYLNIVQFGESVFGVGAASREFFGKSAGELNTKEAALMTAVLPNPIVYRLEEPSHFVRYRQLMILEGMKKVGPQVLGRIWAT